MTNEELCRTCKRRFAPEDQSDCWFCMDNDLYAPDKPIKTIKKRMTNYERIKAMSVGELADELYGTGACPPNSDRCVCAEYDDCEAHWCEWLESECDT